jgi:TolB-like protein
MPFEVAGGDAATDRLAQGIANDISVDFSRLRNLDVIGSSTTEAYGSKGADVRRIARDLNVRYVLTGAIQRESDQFRVSALLQDGSTGASLWSNRWDRPSGDIFAVQNEVSDGVISTLGGRGLMTSLAAMAARRKGPSDLERRFRPKPRGRPSRGNVVSICGLGNHADLRRPCGCDGSA